MSNSKDKDSNMFEDVISDVKSAKKKYMGPDYQYYKFIKTPTELGMSSKGTLSALGNDIDGLVEYVGLLVSGNSKASKTGGPLGNKFFLKTGAKCTDKKTGEEQTRFIYINNVPSGNIPLVSSGTGVNFSEFRGLIPGTISNLNAFNPMGLFQSFLSGGAPDCQPLTMEVIDVHNNKSVETNYVTLIDIQNMDSCIFRDKKNPVTGDKCQETFTQSSSSYLSPSSYPGESDVLEMAYMGMLGGLGIYITYEFMKKMRVI